VGDYATAKAGPAKVCPGHSSAICWKKLHSVAFFSAAGLKIAAATVFLLWCCKHPLLI